MDRIKETFAKCKQERRAALVAYVTAGYPTIEEMVDILLALECGGTGVLISSISMFPFYKGLLLV
jgi:tryptophan synthase